MIMTVEQVSKIYFRGCISKSKIYDLIRQKQIPVLQLSSRRFYFDTKKLDEWVDNGCIMPGQEADQYGKLRVLQA